jgi:hypothetical protein
VIARGAIGTLRLRHGKIGSCCAKGCGTAANQKRAGERIVFVPIDALTKRKS